MNIQIKDVFGKILFEYDKENNTIKDTVVEAVREGISLYGANLCNTNLSFADLNYADLRFANLCHANLIGINLCRANLREAYFYDSDLRNANFRNANLNYTSFRGANLKGANLNDTFLLEADFNDTKNLPYIPLVCPSEGSFIGWKKISEYKEDYDGEFLVKLLIPEDGKRSSATTNKCRCDKAKVLEITNIDNGNTVDVITNINYGQCVYKVGEFVYPDSFDENRWNECSNGIHFFINKQVAIDY